MHRLEFASREQLLNHLQQSSDLSHAVFQEIDFANIHDELLPATLTDNIFLGCTIESKTLALFEQPLVFPALGNLPYRPFRSALYTPEELLGGSQPGQAINHAQTVDGLCYQHFMDTGAARATDIYVTLTRRLHDHSITDALFELIENQKIVAIMGGHSLSRSHAMYGEVARLARLLRQAGFLVASGGGPGAMEATHLGAWFAQRDEDQLSEAIAILSQAPLFQPIDRWLAAAFEVTERFPLTDPIACESLGIPTWLYGHEPPCLFATRIAKYFANSVREEGLLAIANCGVVFTPGAEGTVQEIFQNAAQNCYGTYNQASPMICFGDDFWKYRLPVYPLLAQLSRGKTYGELVSITDDPEQIVRRISEFSRSLGE